MPDFEIVEVSELPYLYIEHTCSMDPADISKGMGEAFSEVWKHMQASGIKPAGPGLSVYYSHDPSKLTFRAGFSVASDDTAEINGNVKADAIPAGRALHHTHVGPYATLRDDYDLMMDYVKNNDLEMRIPSWELYINDPSQVSESELITECYTSLA